MPAIIPDTASDNTPNITDQKPTHSDSPVASITVISDGTAGMRLQAIALGDAIKLATNPTPNLDDIIIDPPPLFRYLPRLAQFVPLLWLRVLVDPKLAELSDSNPTIIITCGRRMAGLSIAMRRLSMAKMTNNRTRTIHIQDPRLPSRYFDILISPKHDPARGSNVVNSMASLNRLDNAKISAAAEDLDPKWTGLPKPCVAVLIGGRNQRYDVSPAMIHKMARKLAKFAVKNGTSLALIPSPRTPKKILIQLTKLLKTTPHAVVAPNDQNPYPGILGIASAIIVTSDSVNMVSEATITGKPVLIAEWQAETGRIKAFHNEMMKAGHTAPLGENIPKTSFTPLFEMPFILRRVNNLLFG